MKRGELPTRWLSEITCAYCGKKALRRNGDIGRAQKIGAPIYCNKVCSGLGRRTSKTLEQKKHEKKLYDEKYRLKNLELIKAKKSKYFKIKYDPEKARIERKARMPEHLEYCRQPEYVAKKSGYDRIYRAKKQYGEFYEAALFLLDIDCEIDSRITRYEIHSLNGTLNKSTQRRRIDGRS